MKTLEYGHTKTGKWTPSGAFERIVAPALMSRGLLPHGDLIAAEGSSQDIRAGIDWIISGRDGTQSTVGARVQWDHDYGSLTIRYRTERGHMSELTKRARSVAADGTFPTYTVQAYVTQPGGILLNAYVVRTAELYRHIIRPSADGDPEHFALCSCAAPPRWVNGGAEFIAVAISEDAKAKLGLRTTLLADGVNVQSIFPINEGRGLWGAGK